MTISTGQSFCIHSLPFDIQIEELGGEESGDTEPVSSHGCCQERVEALVAWLVDVHVDTVALDHHPDQLVPALTAGQMHCSVACRVLQVGVSAGVGEEEGDHVGVASGHCMVEQPCACRHHVDICCRLLQTGDQCCSVAFSAGRYQTIFKHAV